MVALVATAALVCFWAALGSQAISAALHHDFLNLYTGGCMAREGRFAQLHDPALQLAYERRIWPDAKMLVPFVRPHVYAAALAPLTWLPYRTAFWVWVGFQCAVLGACWRWAYRRFGPDALLWGALSLPAALGIAHGQDSPLMLAAAVGAYSLASHGRNARAGAVAGLALIKFHLILLWPVAMLAARRWRMLAGFAATATVLAAVSFALAGPRGVTLYLAMLRNKDLERLSPTPEFMMNVQGLCASLGIASGWFLAAGTALVVALAALAIRRAPLWRWFSAAVIATLLAVPHVYNYDATLLWLPIWLTLFHSQERWSRSAAALAAIPIPYLMTLLDRPWSAAAAVCALLLLAALAREGLHATPDTSKGTL